MTDKQIPNERRQYEYKSVFTYTDNTTDDNDKIMENLHKQIIIDGLDVSGCVAFKYDGIKKPLCRAGGITSVYKSCICADNSNCYYKQLKAKEQECERLKWYLKEIRDDELKTLDIELDEYETHCIDTEYTNIINLVEEALEERSPEDCRYKKDK